MEIIYLIIFFIFGTIMGSFFHVVATRLSQGESIVAPSSHCHYCQHKLAWYDLVPIFSYLIMGGKCRYCHKKLPLSYLLIEIVTGVLYATCFHVFGFSHELIVGLIFISALVTAIVSDIEYMIIIDEVLIVAVMGIVLTDFIFCGFYHTAECIGYGALAFLTMYVIKLIGDKIFQKESLGGGDIKIMFLFGLVLGYPLAIVTIFLATFIAFPIALYILFKSKDSIIPFGPFLCMAAILLFISNIHFAEIIRYLIAI